MIQIRIQDILWGILACLMFLHRYTPVDVSSLWQYTLAGLVFLLARSASPSLRKGMALAMVCWGICEVIVTVLQEGHWIASNHRWFEATGSFGNPGPLGGFLGILCAGVFEYTRKQQSPRSIRILPWIVIGGLLFYGVLASGSRAGLLATLTGAAVWASRKIRSLSRNGHRKTAIITGCAFLLTLSAGGVFLYQLKPLSADGRLLIWLNTLRLMEAHPLTGWGSGGWTGNYMLYQADYLANHPNSTFTFLADNVACPYNEWLHIGAEQGLLGLTLFSWTVVESLKGKETDRLSGSLNVSLWAFLVFSLFSYPLDVIQLLVLGAFLAGTAKSRPVAQCFIPRYIYRLTFSIIIIALSFSSVHLYRLYRNSWHDWTLYRYFQNNPDIMYFHAQKGFIQSDPISRSRLLEQTARLSPNSEIYCQWGDNLLERGCYRKAECRYRKASEMVPVRITPHYKLFKLYLAEGDTTSAIASGRKALTLRLKVESTRILKMRGEIKRFLKKYAATNTGASR